MKLLFSISVLLSIQVYSQVGIGIDTPKTTIDVAGNTKIRSINLIEVAGEAMAKAKDSVLVISQDVHTVTSKNIYESNIRTAIKGTFSQNTRIRFTGAAGNKQQPIIFDSEVYDVSEEFTNGTFTAKRDGIYHIYIQIVPTGSLHLSSNYGVQIHKNGVLYSQQNFANIGVDIVLATINVTPTVRNVQTLVKMDQGQTVSFMLFTRKNSTSLSNLDVTLSGSVSDSFFTINQIR